MQSFYSCTWVFVICPAKKLDEYEWFKEQPKKRPLKIYNPEKLLNSAFYEEGGLSVIRHDTPL